MLLNKETEQKMEREGVAVIPFLLPAELQEVSEFYKEIRSSNSLKFTHGMHMTLWNSEPAFKQKVKDNLLRLLQPAYERNFANCRRLNNIFIVKEANTPVEFAIHNDWSVVDETRFTSMNVWIPLQDTTIENGALWVIKGSHKIDMPIRGGGALLPDFAHLQNLLKPYCTPVTAKAGEAVLFYHKTIHGSYTNLTPGHRIVATFSVIPAQAKLRICFQKNTTGPLEIYEPADDFNYKYNDLLTDTNTFAPGSQPIEVYHGFQQKKITAEDILPLIIKN